MAIDFLIGRKVGMTRIFDKLGSDFPVTIIEAGPCSITQVKSVEKDGISSVQIGFIDKSKRHTKKTEKGHFEKVGVPIKKFVKEFASDKLEDVEWSKRQARFKSVIAIADPEGVIEMFEGTCEGYILFEPIGLNGFGYDPIFYLPLEGKSMSELSLENKNKISHRGLAMEKAVRFLNQIN